MTTVVAALAADPSTGAGLLTHSNNAKTDSPHARRYVISYRR